MALMGFSRSYEVHLLNLVGARLGIGMTRCR